MGLRIQNNVEAFNAHRQLTGTAAKAAKAMEKLSSGYRVNRAADDAELRTGVGAQAHEYVAAHRSMAVCAPAWAELLREAAGLRERALAS